MNTIACARFSATPHRPSSGRGRRSSARGARALLGLIGLLAALVGTAAPVSAIAEEAAVVRRAGVPMIPERFLRRWDAVTFYFDSATGPAGGGAEDRPERFVALSPAHPGAYTWLDARTLQFRPAEPWPALSRFNFRLGGKSHSLVTLMEAPTRTIPADREEGLNPVERITLTFAEPLDPDALRRMLRIGLRPLPGIDESQTRWLDQKDFELKVIERVQRHDPATYVLTLARPIPSGQRAILRLRLAVDDAVAESFKDIAFSTSESFHITAFGCAGQRLPVTPEGVSYARDQALTCNADDRRIQVDFSALPKTLSPIEARNLVRFTPAVEGLSFETRGRMLMVEGRFQSNTLYRARLMPIPLADAHGRPLQVKAESEVFLHFPPKPKYLQWQVGHGIVERFGPQQLPLEGRGFGRVDLRIYPIDPHNHSFWPFPDRAVTTDEQSAPPAPGEEPAPIARPTAYLDGRTLARYIRTLGSPPLSTLVKLPLDANGSAARFGLDLKPHLTALAGAQQPGTYLVGIRRLDESSQRSWVRVQVTDLSLTTVNEEGSVRFAVNSLSTGAPVAGAEVIVEGEQRGEWISLFQTRTDSDGMARWSLRGGNASVHRLVVRNGRDLLVLNPRRAPDRYADNHWSGPEGTWLQWTQTMSPAEPEPSRTLCHVFTERPVYRPEEKVYVKGYIRQRHQGTLSIVAGGEGTLVVDGPGGLNWRYPLKISAQGSFDHEFTEKTDATGRYRFSFEPKSGESCGAVEVSKEAYRAPEFDLRLSAPEEVPLDREFKVQLAAQYYAGGDAAGRPVRWRVTQFPYAWTPRAFPGFFFSSDGRFSGREQFQASPVIEREGETDKNGSATLALNPATETTGQPRTYVIEATVTGADDQTVSTTHRVQALPAVVLGLKAPRYVERASSVSPQLIVVGPDGNLVSKQEVTVRLIKREWHSYLRAGDFTQADAKYMNEVVDRTLSEQKVSSTAKALPVTLALEGAGVYLVELETQDRLGRAQKVSVDFYAGGSEPVSWSRPPSEVFKVTPDKPRYAPGDTAHLVLESPFQEAQGLAIVEAPEGNRYRWFNVRNGAATFDLPVEKHYVPRLPVHFVLMRGRIAGAAPGAANRLDLGKPATVAATSWVAVEPVEHQVKVTLENPARARPGETVSVKIALTDRNNKPAAGEVTLWLVDQAVLALGQEQRLDPIPDFITPVKSRLALQDTRNWTLGILPLSEQPGGDEAAEEGSQDLLDKVTLRRDFLSVPYFNPGIEIGPSGVATVQVKLPDNLTNFKLRAKAISGPDRFGVATGQVSVRLPVIVQPALPRFVRPGDAFTATAIGRIVEGEGGAAVAELRASGVEVAEGTRRSLKMKPDEPLRIEYAVSVPTPQVSAQGEVSHDKVSFTVAVERVADKARDGFEVTLPLKPDRHPLTQRKLLEIGPGGTAELPAVTEAVRPGTLRRKLMASDRPALVRMAGGLNFLMSYPHGCTEQRTSRARAFIAMREFNQLMQRPGQDAELTRVVNEVLAWLPGVVDAQGLVSYWPGSTGYVSLTAWVTEFLIEARAAGFAVDQNLLDRLTGTLRQALRSDYSRFITGEAHTERVMALRALAAAGKLDSGYLAELARRTEILNLEASAQVLRLLYQGGGQAAASREGLGKKVADGVVIRLHQGKEIYGGLQDTASARNHLILPSETRTLAEIVRATVAAPKPDSRLDLLTDALVTLGHGDGWGSTQANAAALMALSQILKGKGANDDRQTLALTVGAQKHTLELGKASAVASFATNSAARIQLDAQGKRPLLVRAETTYLPQALGSQAPAGASGFIVSREVLRPRGEGEAADRQRLDAPGATIALTVGDLVEDHVEVVTNVDLTFVAVVVPLAAGLEPLNPTLATAPAEATPTGHLSSAPSYVAYHDDQVTFYYDRLPKGSHHFYFRTRATVAGKFTQPQARAELMYDEAVHGESVGARVEIRPGAR